MLTFITRSVHDGSKKCSLTMPPRILVLARSLLVADAGRSRFCWDEERRSRAAAEEDPVQMREVMSTERDKGSHSQPALHARTEISKLLLKNTFNKYTMKVRCSYNCSQFHKDVKSSNLALPWDRETVMETKEMGSVDKGNLKVTEVMGLKDRGTETETGGKDPRGPGRAHSESHCCIFGQEQGPCDHLGYPKSEIFRRKQVITRLLLLLSK